MEDASYELKNRIVFYEGSITKFDNLDQLAFIMAHEVSHGILKH
jgi:Zn-dependent metalloprotease